MTGYNKVVLKVSGLAAVKGGGAAAESALKQLPGVLKARATCGEMAVTYDPDATGQGDLKRVLSDLGLHVESLAVVDEDELSYFRGG